MRDSDWRAWLEGLPSTRSQLQEIQADLERLVVLSEDRLSAAMWRSDSQAQRSLRIELNELNSKLLAIRARLTTA